VKDVKEAADGIGPHAAIVVASNVCICIASCVFLLLNLSSPGHSIKLSCIYAPKEPWLQWEFPPAEQCLQFQLDS
jgi:hypothetical protein